MSKLSISTNQNYLSSASLFANETTRYAEYIRTISYAWIGGIIDVCLPSGTQNTYKIYSKRG